MNALVCKRCGYKLKLSDKVCPACSMEVEEVKTKNHKSHPVAIFIILLAAIILVCGFLTMKKIQGISDKPAVILNSNTTAISETEVESSATETVSSENNPFIDKLQIIPFTSDGTNKMSYRGYVKTSSDDFFNLSSDELDSFVDNACSDKDLSWITISFGDNTGVVFSKEDPESFSYGVIDEIGKLSAVYGLFVKNSSGELIYHQILNNQSESTLSQTEVLTETTTEVTSEITEELTSSAENITSKAETSESTTEATSQSTTVTQPKATTTQAVTSSVDSEEFVFITASGEKYHRSSCACLKKSKIQISRNEAIEKGYTPCSKCNP